MSTLNDANRFVSSDEYMQTSHAEWIVYSMCALSIAWAIIQTCMLSRMNLDPSKVKH